jgi:nucleoside phosphorylase
MTIGWLLRETGDMTPGRHGKTTVGVLTVIDEEFEAAISALGANQRHGATRYFHAAPSPERFVVTKMPDRGNGPAQEAARAMIEHWRPDIVLLVGIAGALDGGPAGLGDVVIADYIHYGDFRKITEHEDALRFAAYDQPTVSLRVDSAEAIRAQQLWVSRLTSGPPDGGVSAVAGRASSDLPHVEVGGIVAGEKVVGDPDHPEQQRLFVSFDSAIAVDMESFGVARGVHGARSEPDYNPRLLVIRGISDLVHRKRPRDLRGVLKARMPIKNTTVTVNNEQRRVWKSYAAHTAASFAAAIVDEVAP